MKQYLFLTCLTSLTCIMIMNIVAQKSTPLRHSILIDEYAWKRLGTGIVVENTRLIIRSERPM